MLPPGDKVKEMFKQCMLTSNVGGLRPIKINQIVYKKLKGSFRVNDQQLHGINTFLARGLGRPHWINTGQDFEIGDSSQQQNIQISGLLAVLQFDNICSDFTEMRRQLDQSIKLLSTAHCIILDRRRSQLRSFFDPKFHYLFKASNPITSELLGDNVDLKVAEATKISEAAQKLQILRQILNRQGRNRGRFACGRKQSGWGFRLKPSRFEHIP